MEGTELPRVLRPGYRLVASIVTAILAFRISKPLLPDASYRVLLAWDAGVICLLTLIAVMMWRTEACDTLRRARKEETSNIVVLMATVLAVAGALVDIGYGLPKSRNLSPSLRLFDIAQSVAGVFLAWLLLHVMYSLHYAKLYYAEIGHGDTKAFKKGFVFPGNQDEVDYWDFVYYSFTIAMCFQTSDVMVTSGYMRRLTIFHAVVAYFFALAILGLLLDGFMASIT